MPVDRSLQATFASGEFDPLLAAREDVAFYYSSAKLLENVVPLPQGGAKRRGGFKALGLQRGLLTEVTISGYSFSAPNGGTATNFYSTSSALTTTTGISTSTAYVIAKINAGSAVRLSLLDVAIWLSGGTQDNATISLQSSSDDVTYTTRASIVIGTTEYERRFALAPDNDLGTYRYWRLIVDNAGATDFGSDVVKVYKGAWFQEAGYSQSSTAPGDVRVRKITASSDDEYFAVITDQNCDIWSAAGVWQAAVAIPHVEADVLEVKTSQNLDTLILYHEDSPPHVVQRLDDTDDRWRSGAFSFYSVSQFPFEDSTSGGQNEKQHFTFNDMTAGDTFVFEFNGDVSAAVTWNATHATNVSNIETAIEGLEDITSITATDAGNNDVAIEFDGVDAKKFFATMIIAMKSSNGTATVTRTQYGRPDQEDLWGATRGYPRCGTFYQGRHFMGGFRGQPDVIAASRAGDFTDFKEDASPVATSPLLLQPDIDDQVTIENIYPGRSLQIFTSSAELFIPTEPITPENVALKVSSKRGSYRYTQPIDIQGGTLFVDRNGTAIREYLYLDTEQNYTSEPISILAGHLVSNPVEMALQRSVDTDDPTILYVVNTGRDRDHDKVDTASVTIDRAQQVTAFARIATDGTVKAVAATQGGQVAFMVNRELAGNAWNYLETPDDDHMGDHSYEIANPDLETFTATAGQTDFVYTFSNPLDPDDIGVFSREDSTDVWTRVEPTDYTLTTGTKTVAFDSGLAAGVEVLISPRATTFSTGAPELDDVACYLHADGRAVGAHTPSSGSVTILGDEGFWINARIGLLMLPVITLQAYKGKGGSSPTMQKQRIFRALVSLERTANVAIGIEGQRARAVSLNAYDVGMLDADLEEVLFTGVKRVSGIGKWETEPRLQITQTEPGPFLVRSVTYDVRF